MTPGVRSDELEPTRTVDVAGLVATFPALRDRLMDEGATRAAAATYLAGWFGGTAAAEVAKVLITEGRGITVDRSTIRWRLASDGSPEGVDAGSATCHGAAEHGQAQPITRSCPRDTELATALVAALGPVIDACHELGGVAWSGLWNEVADGFAYALDEPEGSTDVGEAMRTIDCLTALEGAPWRRRPRLTMVPTAVGQLCVMQKGGCCLAFTGNYPQDPTSLDALDREYAVRFPEPPDAKDYCTTCPHRTFEDCTARQTWWHIRQHS